MSNNRVQWRRFAFFDKDVVDENILLQLGAMPSCGAAEGGMLVFGDENGNISLADRNFRVDRKVKAFRGEVGGVSYHFDPNNHRRQYVVAVGDDTRIPAASTSSSSNASANASSSISSVPTSSSYNYIIKVFSTNGDMTRPNLSIPVVSSHLPSSAKLTAFSALPDASQLALGFSSGTVLLYSGAILSESSSSNSNSRQFSPQVLLPRHPKPVSSLNLCELSSTRLTERKIRLYVVLDTDYDSMNSTGASGSASSPQRGGDRHDFSGSGGGDDNPADGGILVFDTSVVITAGGAIVPAQRRPPNVLDERGACAGCASLMKETSELVVGRLEGVFSYGVDDRGGAAGLEGDKQCVSAIGRHILVACLDEKTKRTNVTIYDLRNKFISTNSSLPLGDRVVMVLHDGGTAYIITASASLIRFKEKDTASKLDVLLRKSLYQLAISLAAEEQSDISEIMKLYKSYGDHLYKKGEFDAASTQYCHTIGYIQSSYVVRKFLDPHRIGNLVTYLEKLHERGLATKDHTTLLLICYTKMKDEAKISEFCRTSRTLVLTTTSLAFPPSNSFSSASTSTSGSSSSSSSAMNRPATSPMTTPFTSFSGTKKNEVKFDVEAAVDILSNAGFTEHALQLAVEHRKHNAYLRIQTSKTPPDADNALAYLVALIFDAVTTEEMRTLIITHARQLLVKRPEETTALLIKLCTGDYEALRPASHNVSVSVSAAPVSTNLSPLSIDDILPLYADNEKYLRILMEGVHDAHRGGILPATVAGTLLELYLFDYSTQKEALLAACAGKSAVNSSELTSPSLRACEEKIMSILDGFGSEYDTGQALLLTHAFGFEAGQRFLLEKLHSVELLLRMYMDNRDDNSILKLLRREGRKDPELYVQVLSFFVKQAMPREEGQPPRNEEEEEERWDSVIEMLSLIEKEAVLSPMQIIAVLSTNPELPLKIALKFIKRTLRESAESVVELETEVTQMRSTIDGIMQEEAARRQLGPMVSRAVLRAKAKEARIAEAKRNGSYDEDYEEDDEDEMDNAALEEKEKMLEQKKWEGIKRAQLDRSSDHEAFFSELAHSSDGFGTIAHYFGKVLIK